MFRSRASSAVAVRRGLFVVVACMALGACGNVKEWEEKPGTLTLRAAPLPAVEGMPLALSVEGSNVGPVSVYQGDSLIATFANVTLDGKQSFTVTAASDETPRAEALAYDFRRVSVEAKGFSGQPSGGAGSGGGGGGSGGEGGTNGAAGVAGGGAGGMSGGGGVPAVENCPGMIAGSVCSHPLGGSVQVTLFNQRSVTLAVFQRDPLPQPCKEKAVGTIAPDSSLTLPNVEAGVSLVVREDPSGTEVKWFEVPGGPSCVLVF